MRRIYEGALNPSSFNLTDRFIDGIGFFIRAKNLASELRIDAYIQVFLPVSATEEIRNLPFSKVIESSILLNETDTESFVIIPEELSITGIEMAILFLASQPVDFEVYIIEKDSDINDIMSLLDRLFLQGERARILLEQILREVDSIPKLCPTEVQYVFPQNFTTTDGIRRNNPSINNTNRNLLRF